MYNKRCQGSHIDVGVFFDDRKRGKGNNAMIKNRCVAVTEQQETADGCNDLEGHEATCSVLYVSIWGCCPAHATKGR